MQAMGPFERYVRKKAATAIFSWPPLVATSIRDTVSGLKIPCAVGKLGSVSQEANTELDNRQLFPLIFISLLEEEGDVVVEMEGEG